MVDHAHPRFVEPVQRATSSEETNGHGVPRRAHARLPTLFGRLTAVLDNRRHPAPVERLEAFCSDSGTQGEPRSAANEQASLLMDASRDLSEQFAKEEAAGYYGVVLDERPELASRIAELKRDHVAILRVLELLHEVSSVASLRQQLVACTRGLASKLRAHEADERLLLEELFAGGHKRAMSRSGTYARGRPDCGVTPALVLLVEDERAVRSMVKRMLEGAGFSVVEAPDAVVALRLLLERFGAIRAIVSDVGLPDISGPEFVRAARVICPNIAAMHMSGDERDYLLATGRIGPDAVLLEKPFRVSDLLACLTAILPRRP
jgi:CheY-like chemotaxis protein